MIVHHLNRQSKYPLAPWRILLDRVVPRAFAASDVASECKRRGILMQVTIVYAGPRIMQRLNRESRKVDRITDVLSFPQLKMKDGRLLAALQDQDFDLSQSPKRIVPLGDIVISLDQAKQQAAQYHHTLQREVAFLAVHGLLHLLGFDHQDRDSESLMLEKQRQVLESMNLFRNEGDLYDRK